MSTPRKPKPKTPPPSAAKPVIELDVSTLLVPVTDTLDVPSMIEDRINFYAGRIDAMAAELSAPGKPALSDVEAHGERIRDLQRRCAATRLILHELRLIRTAITSGMSIAPGANPSQV